MKRWKYYSQNLNGNLHDSVRYLNESHPEWDIVAMSFTGGHHTVVVYRLAMMEFTEVKEVNGCMLAVVLKAKDVERFERAFFKLNDDEWIPNSLFDEYKPFLNTVVCTVREAYHAWSDELQAIADQGIVFKGSQNPWGDTDGYDFAAFDKLRYCKTHQGGRVVYPDGDSDYDRFLGTIGDVDIYLEREK